jgi:hypothetical protein
VTKKTSFLSLMTAIMLLCAGCQRIHLGGGGDTPPPIEGDWKITFLYLDQPHESTVTFAQKGKALEGQGTDEGGKQFFVKGTVDGKQVRFTKQYLDADPSVPPIDYAGQISYEDDEDYKGWKMDGHYKATVKDQPVDDKWVAVNAKALADFEAKQQQAQQQAQQQQEQQQQQTSDTTNGAGEVPASLTGTYRVAYDYNFNHIDTRLFLTQNANKLTGDGVDRTTNEYFVITKGFYSPPRIMIVCHYEKGKHARFTRDITIKGEVEPSGSIKGETQFGAAWTATMIK